MKGARGLLISITGGKDLTLYEVDEAATRIREEVDQDANIIVGATFDESLEGIIRVSVVATGIDQAALQRAPNAPEARIAELTQKLRADQLRAEQQQPRFVPERNEPRMQAHAPASPPPSPQQIPGVDRGRCPGRGCGRGAADDGGRDDPADPAEAVAVPRADGAAARAAAGAACVHPAGPGACRAIGRAACRRSTNCRVRPRPSCAPGGARKTRIIRKSAR